MVASVGMIPLEKGVVLGHGHDNDTSQAKHQLANVTGPQGKLGGGVYWRVIEFESSTVRAGRRFPDRTLAPRKRPYGSV
jgi:hypothetical protein